MDNDIKTRNKEESDLRAEKYGTDCDLHIHSSVNQNFSVSSNMYPSSKEPLVHTLECNRSGGCKNVVEYLEKLCVPEKSCATGQIFETEVYEHSRSANIQSLQECQTRRHSDVMSCTNMSGCVHHHANAHRSVSGKNASAVHTQVQRCRSASELSHVCYSRNAIDPRLQHSDRHVSSSTTYGSRCCPVDMLYAGGDCQSHINTHLQHRPAVSQSRNYACNINSYHNNMDVYHSMEGYHSEYQQPQLHLRNDCNVQMVRDTRRDQFSEFHSDYEDSTTWDFLKKSDPVELNSTKSDLSVDLLDYLDEEEKSGKYPTSLLQNPIKPSHLEGSPTFWYTPFQPETFTESPKLYPRKL